MQYQVRLTAITTIAVLAGGCNGRMPENDSAFERSVLFVNDADTAPWAKFAGDLDGDGLSELFAGYHGNGDLVQIARDGQIARPVVLEHAVLTDGGVADINADGHADIALLTEHGVVAFFGPDYEATRLSSEKLHDLKFVDQDGDGHLEIVVRNQTAFGNGTGDVRILSGTRGAAPWDERTLYEAEGEGLEVSDIDADGDNDIALQGVVLENLGNGEWLDHRFTRDWNWPHAKVTVADVDGDNRMDVLLAPAEPAGERFRISWFQQPETWGTQWTEHVLVADVETVIHSLQAGDIDLDGDVDVVYAEMHQGTDPDEVVVLENRGAGDWRRRVIGTMGSHNVQLFDHDGDGDLDLAGANWDGMDQSVYLWRNMTCDQPWAAWSRHVIDDGRPGQAVFVFSGDLDGDGWPDVVSGSAAYLNPGKNRNGWRRVLLGDQRVDAASALDFDRDGDLDILVTLDDPARPHFELRRNDGAASFAVVDSGIELSGDFLQGAAVLDTASQISLMLSWHKAGVGVERLSLPFGELNTWRIDRVSDYSQDEALSIGDIDGDGDADVVLGTRWLRNKDGMFKLEIIDDAAPAPDRNVLADIDGDGDLDVVVGFEAISTQGDIAWYSRDDESWERHDVGTVIGPMSLGVADIDSDGDLDIIVGEHNLSDPESAILWAFENVDGHGRNWRPHRIYTGDEHHDGAHIVDIDLDGDPDIVSIGWGHDDVIWYENKMPKCSPTPHSGS